ncbi:MAG: HEAT repeat domain-containing protein [Deltaproteobacteria bacterium]|nr:HEAT repeat domain-containing protein [Deltaproteobacteria bacterium]
MAHSRRYRRYAFWLAGAAALTLAVAALLLRSQPDAPSTHTEPDPRPLGFDWSVGASQSYQLLVTTRIRMQLPKTAGPEAFEQRISGELHMKVFEADEERVRLGFQLSPVSYTLADAPAPEIEAGLSAPFLAVFERGGRPLDFSFPDDLERQQRIILEEIVRTFQLVFADGSQEPSRTWTHSEEHATGRYLAYYRAGQDGNLRKRKTLYTRVDVPVRSPDPAERPKIHLKKSSAALSLAPGVAWLSEASVEEDLVITAGSERVTEALMKAELLLVSTAPDAPVSLFSDASPEAILAEFSAKATAPGQAPAAEEESEQASSAARKRFGDLVSRIGGEPSLERRIKDRVRLEDLLREHPELAYELIDSIEAPGVSKDADATLLHALERAGTIEAQEVLVMVMDDPELTQLNRSRAIVGLGGVEGASDEAIDALFHTYSNNDNSLLANTSLLAVGAIGRGLRETEPQRAGGVRGDLGQSLAAAGSAEEVGIALKAIGNMGDPALTGAIVPHIDDPSPFVRASAAWALASVRAEGVVGRLTEQLVVEPEGRVRSEIVAAMDGLGDERLDALSAVHEMILDEPDPSARYRMARYLGNNLDAYPDGLEPLIELAVSDSSSRVRKYAVSVATGGRDG